MSKILSVVMASFNEEESIVQMIKDINVNTKDYDTEIVLVDSSIDKTAEIAREMGARVILQEPRGHGIALRTAIMAAKGDYIITTDCDNTYPMHFIPKLVSMMDERELDIISCNRLNVSLNKEMPFINQLGNMTFAFLVRWLYGIKVNDVSTGMFCMRSGINNKIRLRNNYSVPCEMIIKSNLLGLNFLQVDIPYEDRIGEVTLNRWKSGKSYLKCIFKYRFNIDIPVSEL